MCLHVTIREQLLQALLASKNTDVNMQSFLNEIKFGRI